MRAVLSAVVAAVLLAVAGCDGDDAEPTTTQAQPAPSTAEEPREQEPPQRVRRTPENLAACIRSTGARDVLVKGRDSEDARFFAELVGGRVDVLGVTLSGQPTEVTVALFASPADARRAAPSAGGGGVVARPHGAAVVVAPSGARTSGVEGCLRETGYE